MGNWCHPSLPPSLPPFLFFPIQIDEDQDGLISGIENASEISRLFVERAESSVYEEDSFFIGDNDFEGGNQTSSSGCDSQSSPSNFFREALMSPAAKAVGGISKEQFDRFLSRIRPAAQRLDDLSVYDSMQYNAYLERAQSLEKEGVIEDAIRNYMGCLQLCDEDRFLHLKIMRLFLIDYE